MDDIVGLLLDRAFRLATRDFNGDGARLAKEAADEILRLRAENEKLRAALKPFADAAEDLDEDDKDNRSIWEHWVAGYIEIGHLRAAAAALKETNDDN